MTNHTYKTPCCGSDVAESIQGLHCSNCWKLYDYFELELAKEKSVHVYR